MRFNALANFQFLRRDSMKTMVMCVVNGTKRIKSNSNARKTVLRLRREKGKSQYHFAKRDLVDEIRNLVELITVSFSTTHISLEYLTSILKCLSCEINILKKIIIHSGIENFLRYSLLDSNGQDVQMAECKQEIIWAYKHPNKKDRKTGKYWFGRMKTVTGVKRKEAKLEDFQRLYKCEGYKADVCNNKGLTYPAKCSSPPCNICLGPKTSMSFIAM